MCPGPGVQGPAEKNQAKGVSLALQGFKAVSDLRSLSSRLQTDQEPSPLPQGSWASDGYSTPPGGTEDDVSCLGKCPGRRTSSGGGEATAQVHLFTVGRRLNCTPSFGHA